MNIRNEVKVGILGLLALVLLFWGYNFLKGKNVFTNDIALKAVFESVEGLQIAAPVTINGYKVGAVVDIYLDEQDSRRVIAVMNLAPGTQVPKSDKTIAYLVQPSLMSGKAIALRFEGNCSAGSCLQSGDIVQGRIASMFDDVKAVADPYLQKFDSVANVFADIAKQEQGTVKESVEDLRLIVGNVRSISDQVNNLLVSSSANIAITVSNLKAISDNLKQSNDEISSMIANLSAISEQVKRGDVEKTLVESRKTVETLNKTITEMQTTLRKTNETIDQAKSLLDLKNQNGVLSKLLYDKEFAAKIGLTIEDLDLLLRDIRLNPHRYRTVLSGKKKPYKPTPLDQDPGHK